MKKALTFALPIKTRDTKKSSYTTKDAAKGLEVQNLIIYKSE